MEGGGKNADCPVCSRHLNELGKHLPYAHCANSKLICYITGHPLNEHNPPMMLPNGYVYGCNVSLCMDVCRSVYGCNVGLCMDVM